MQRRDGLPSLIALMPRKEYFTGLFVLACINGLAARAILLVSEFGWVEAILRTFEISVIVLLACLVGLELIFHDKPYDSDSVRSSDIAVGAGCLLLVALPISGLSWLAVTVLSIYILLFVGGSSSRRRGAIVLLAVTVPMLWSRLLFQLVANSILAIDASLVGWILRTNRTGHMVRFADNSGTLVILPPCSSLANVSLAILCWVTISQLVRHRWSPVDILWCLFAGVSVIAVNVTRISLMGLSGSHYDAIHSTWGDAVVNVIILSLTVGISLLGVRRELFSRA
jgi:hypothetical protein